MNDVRSSGTSSASSRGGGDRSGFGSGASSDIEFRGLGIDGGHFGGALYQVDTVASTRGGPTTARRADTDRVCSDCIDEGCQDDVTRKKLAILAPCLAGGSAANLFDNSQGWSTGW